MSGDDSSGERDDAQSGQPAAQGGQPAAQGAQGGQAAAQGGQVPPGNQPAGQQRDHGGPSLLDQLQRPASMRWLKFNVAAFLAVGVGYSVAFFLFDALAPSSGLGGQMFSGFVAVMAFFVGLLLAPLIAAVTSLRIASEFRDERNVVVANSFVGSAVGFLVMFFVLFLFVWSTVGGSGGSGGGGSLGDLLLPIVGFAVGVGLTGALTAYVTREL